MPYLSSHTGQAIDEGININTTQNQRLTDLENNQFKLTDNCIKTSYIQNKAITEDKLADSVKDSLSSIKSFNN